MKLPLLNSSKIKMLKSMQSFDIFDTLLVRIWAKPTDLFWELGWQLQKALLTDVSPETWQRIRIEAENAARQKDLTGEVTLNQIYEELRQTFGWSSTEVEKAINLEITLERSSLRPIPETQRQIRESHQQQQEIAYLSDMYLPTEIIKGFLKEHQIWANGDVLYVSAEVGFGKGSGRLFEHHLARYGLKSSQLHHRGDNLHADVRVPQKMGIQVTPFLKAHLNRYERLIADNETLPLRFRSLVAGASRLCRLQCPETDPHRQTIWHTAANVVAPLIFGFVWSVLRQAKEQGIQRLYFMARDGQILLKVAREICSQWNYNIECRYLYGSRQAFHFPSIQELGETEFNWLFDSRDFFSVRIICQRVHLEPEQIADTLANYGFPSQSWDKKLADGETIALKKVFQEPAVIEPILTMAATYREKAIGYFKQEGMGDETPFATVDIGWSGKSQRSLSRLLAAGGIYPATGLKGFFFGLLSTTQAFPSDQLMPYYLAANELTERRFLCDPQILELFMAGDHGSTLRYEKQGDLYIPTLLSAQNESGIAWGVLGQQQAVVEFAKCLTENLSSQECQDDSFCQITDDLLKTFVRSPSKAESETFGTQPFSHHQSESKFYDLAPAYNLIDGLKILFNPDCVHSFAWLAASIKRSHPLTKLTLRYVKGRRQSFSYAFWAWQEFQKGNNKLSQELAIKALKSSYSILLSKRFLRMSFILTARSLIAAQTETPIGTN
jgi:FMN phosphatase YigB (HAD superfamily)